MESINNNNSKPEIEKASADVQTEQGLYTPTQSADAFSVAEIEFGGNYKISKDKNRMTNLDYALKYLKKGWSIIPIAPRSKLPAIKSWTEYQTTPPTEQEVGLWFRENQNYGLALVCGKVSGVIVVDIDSGKGEVDKAGLELPPTLAQKTGSGGSHLIYKWREGLTGPKVGIRKGIDIRSDNSYIILAPSTHPNGNLYEWMIDDDEDITPAPAWLELAEQAEDKTDWEKFFSEQKKEGLRNMSASKVAGKILYDMPVNVWDTLGIITFKGWNKEYNKPPLSETELMTVWESIKKTHLKNNDIKEDDKIDKTDEEEIATIFKKNKTEATYLLAQHIVNKYSIVTIGEKDREMYIYKDGMYYPGAENLVIFPEIQKILGPLVTKNAKSETFHKIADATSHHRSVFTSVPLNLVPLKNGVYNIETGELMPHSPDYRFVYQFPITYNAEAKCPKTSEFMEEVLSPEQKTLMEEWIGYYFYRNYIFKKAIIFVGAGDTGKTTLLEVITYLLGRDNISSISLQKMSSDRFSAAHLYNKHGNLVDELSARDITDTGSFKVATGGGTVTGEYKFGNQFSFHNFSKFTFACNRIPDVNDMNDEAYFNRWIVVRFENQIKKIIPNFIDTLRTEEERSGLFNLAMKGLDRLLRQKRFSYFNNADDTKNEMMRSGSSIAMFASDMLIKEFGEQIDKETMYDAYIEYCHRNKLAAQTKEMLGRRIPDYVHYISDSMTEVIQPTGKYKKVRVWRNVKLKILPTEVDKIFDQM